MVASAPFVPKRGRLAFTCDILAVWIDKTETEREKKRDERNDWFNFVSSEKYPSGIFLPGLFPPPRGVVSGGGFRPQLFHLSSRLVRTAAPRESRSKGGALTLGCATKLRRGRANSFAFAASFLLHPFNYPLSLSRSLSPLIFSNYI